MKDLDAHPTIATRLMWLAAAGLAFLVVYVGTGWITANRSDVGSWFHPAELEIPLVPWMIVPYWSIDLFFVGVFFLARTGRELRAVGQRIISAISIAGLVFLVLPLELGFPRSAPSGAAGDLFNALYLFDGPHNLFPSVHIALCVVLGCAYARHAPRWAHPLVHGWFGLVGVSTLFTHQHHLMDVAGGAALGAFCIYAVRETASTAVPAWNLRVGVRYGLGATAVTVASIALWPWGAIGLWPALSLGLASAAYLGAGGAVYRKENGRIPASAWWVNAPCLIGQRISLEYYRRECRALDAITDRVWMGRVLDDSEAEEALRRGVRAVLDLTAEFPAARPFARVAYLNLPILDLTAPSSAQLEQAVAFIAAHEAQGVVLIHCKAGYSRSAAVAGAYLLARGLAADPEAAIALMRRARPTLVIRPEVSAALTDFARSLAARAA